MHGDDPDRRGLGRMRQEVVEEPRSPGEEEGTFPLAHALLTTLAILLGLGLCAGFWAVLILVVWWIVT
jgi:hypothetical protein